LGKLPVGVEKLASARGLGRGVAREMIWEGHGLRLNGVEKGEYVKYWYEVLIELMKIFDMRERI
jgi:hypothetical protein